MRQLLPVDAEWIVPQHFYVEVAGVLRRWERQGILSAAKADQAIRALIGWPLRRADLVPLLAEAWRRRHNMILPDGLYVALAAQLGADLLTDDHKLAATPGFPSTVAVLRLPLRP